MVRRHHCVKFVVPLNLLNVRWEHRPCMSLCLFFSRFKISPSLEHSDMYGIKRLATGNGVSRTKDLLFLHGEFYAPGLPFITKDCLTWCCLSLLHLYTCLIWGKVFLGLQTAKIHVSQCAGKSLSPEREGRCTQVVITLPSACTPEQLWKEMWRFRKRRLPWHTRIGGQLCRLHHPS